MNIFEVKVSYDALQENGLTRKVTETYLLPDTLSFSEAEQRTIDHCKDYHHEGEFQVLAVKLSKIKEVVHAFGINNARWFSCKLAFITLNENTGKERREKVGMLVEAENIEDAKRRIDAHMSTTLLSYEVLQVGESDITEVLEYHGK